MIGIRLFLSPAASVFYFPLPTGEIVLIPTDTSFDYEGFIFQKRAAFEKMVKEDFYPVSDQYLFFWEIERDH
jgi:hypothetical protein